MENRVRPVILSPSEFRQWHERPSLLYCSGLLNFEFQSIPKVYEPCKNLCEVPAIQMIMLHPRPLDEFATSGRTP